MREAMAAHDYNHIVLDLTMPGEDDLTILRCLAPATAAGDHRVGRRN